MRFAFLLRAYDRCSSCKQAIPRLNQITEAFTVIGTLCLRLCLRFLALQELVVVGVTDQQSSAVEKFLGSAEVKPSYAIAIDSEGKMQSALGLKGSTRVECDKRSRSGAE